MKKILKLIVAVPVYLFLLFEGLFGGSCGKHDDKWDDMMEWVNK